MPKQKKIKLLFCINDRGEARRSCGGDGANALRKYAREKAADNPGIKIKKSGCLGLCKQGPVIELLPAKRYYRCRDEADIDRLLAGPVEQGEIDRSLLIKTAKGGGKR